MSSAFHSLEWKGQGQQVLDACKMTPRATMREVVKLDMTVSVGYSDFELSCRGRPDRMSHRKWRETKQKPSRARSGHQISCCLVYLHFLCNILSGHPVKELKHFKMAQNHTMLASGYLMRIQANVDDSGSS